MKISQLRTAAPGKPVSIEGKLDTLIDAMNDLQYKVARNDKGLPPQNAATPFSEGQGQKNGTYNSD